MKRAVAFALAACLSLQLPTSALAQQPLTQGQETGETQETQEQTSTDQKEQPDSEKEEANDNETGAKDHETQTKDEETKDEETKNEETKDEETKEPEDGVETLPGTEDPDSGEIERPGETQPDETQPGETQPEETRPEETEPDETQPETGAEDENPNLPDEKPENDTEEKTGSVEVKFHSVLVKEHDIAADILIYDKTDEEPLRTSSIQAKARDGQTEPYETTVTVLDQIPEGNYVLELSQEGYETYRQNIQVNEDKMTQITIIDDYLDVYYETAGSAHPGVFRLGDVTGDQMIDKEDEEALLDALQTGGGDDVFADLNGDGQVDLVDLQYFTLFYQNKRASDASVTYRADIKADMLEEDPSHAPAEGDLMDLFDGDSDTSVILKPEKEDEAVSEDNPIQLDLTFKEPVKDTDGIVISQPKDTKSQMEAGLVEVYGEHGDDPIYTLKIEDAAKSVKSASVRSRWSARASIHKDANGDLVLNLGGQVAVKKISIKVTATSGNSLAEISKVEFLNGMENRIPEPEMNIPQGLTAEVGNKEFRLSWKPEKNVTGYEVKILQNGKKAVIETEQNFLEVTSFNGDKLKNGIVYEVSVQSVNGEWRSGYSAPIEVITVTDEAPDAPEDIKITGAWKRLNVTWKDMEDTDHYTIYYRVKGSDSEYQVLDDIKGNSAVIRGLEEEVEYELYITGTNEIGTSKPSAKSVGTTLSMTPPKTPNYNLINTAQGEGEITNHIVRVEYPKIGNNTGILDNGVYTPMSQIPVEELQDHFEIVDGKYDTSWQLKDWDGGVIYRTNALPIVCFDSPVTMDTMVVVPDDDQPYTYADARLVYWDKNGQKVEDAKGSLTKITDSSTGKIYYEFQTEEPFTATKVQLNLTNRYGNASLITVSEMKFYYYDSLEDEIYGLYKDDMHLELKDGVDQTAIDGLRGRLETPDKVSGEYHPKQESLRLELKNAEEILNDKTGTLISVNNQITKNADGHITFGSGLNAWQPLGVTALAGDNLVLYVGNPNKKTGENANLKVIATQYHGESGTWHTTAATSLKVGRNEIKVSSANSMDVEQGGQLYIEYTGDKGAENYSVRVLGGSKIPTLDISTATPSEARKLTATQSNARRAKVVEYVTELESYVGGLKEAHDSLHSTEEHPTAYDEKNCILGATDIVMNNMMFSVSAKQILGGLKGSDIEEKADQLYESLLAMENMVDLFYQTKGLSYDPNAGAKNMIPSSRLNIRYQRMFAGAFMYAGGLHIGIEWDSVPGLTGGKTVVTHDDQGRYKEGQYFGWGIAHEIGHIINEGAYAVAEVTNNYFSVLAQAKDTNDSVRFSYDNVYDKVTSGVKGPSSNVFTQLGMYWQLHLAYDRGGYNFKMYDTYQEQFDNLIFARMDTYARDTAKAPQPGGVALTLTKGDTDNNLMRLACAGAQKDLLEFFRRWGMTPDEGTIAYASQFDKEERAIWFMNDEARAYELEGKNRMLGGTAVNAEISYATGSNAVKITNISNTDGSDAMLGYEIYRTEWVRGENMKSEKVRRSVGFVTADKDSFIDYVTTANNRVYEYEIVGYDKLLNETVASNLGTVKVSHAGVMNPDEWSVTTNLEQKPDGELDGENPETPVEKASDQIIDRNTNTTFNAVYPDSGTAEFILNLNSVETISGLTYTYTAGIIPGNKTEQGGTEEDRPTVPLKDYTISVSADGKTWKEVKKGTFALPENGDDNQTTTWNVMFDKENDNAFYTYEASYVKLSAKGAAETTLSVSELGLLGRSGDKIELLENGIGILKEDYILDAENVIPAGSVIFTGVYAGNPAYNMVLLYDENGSLVGGFDEDGVLKAEQVIFAEAPKDGNLGEVSEGIWVYYIEPEHLGTPEDHYGLPSQVRAELYRVNDAQTNEGERLVSNTMFIEVPDSLPEISLEAGSRQAYRP